MSIVFHLYKPWANMSVAVRLLVEMSTTAVRHTGRATVCLYSPSCPVPNIVLIQNRHLCVAFKPASCFATVSHTRAGKSVHHSQHRNMSLWTEPKPFSLQRLGQKKIKTLTGSFSLAVRSQNNQSHNYDSSRSSDAKDICEDIYKKIAFIDDHLVAVNKPYGLSVFGNSNKPSESGLTEHNTPTLAWILPRLRDKLNCLQLDVGLSLKSFYSGVVLLTKQQESASKLKKVVANAQTHKEQFMTYLTITVGVPQCSHGADLTAYVSRERLHNKEISVVSDTFSHSACKRGTMLQICFNVRPLAVNPSVGAALVQVTLNKDKWEVVEVLMSHHLSPVLGDHIYSNRTQVVAGVPFLSSAHASLPGTQRLPSTIEEVLGCCTKDVPLFAHRHKVLLNQFPSKGSLPLVITAPPPPDFLTTLHSLGLCPEGMFS